MELAIFNGLVIFGASDGGGTGRELWRSDGTEAGTFLIKDINPGPIGGIDNPRFVVWGNSLYFTADDGLAGTELWKTDGSATGTLRVADLNPGTANSNPEVLALENMLLVGTYGSELWKSDGTTAGTVLLKDLDPGPPVSSLERLTRVGDTVFFTAFVEGLGEELWKTDGTAEGTVLVKDIRPGSESASPIELMEMGGILYFVADDGTHGYELWRSDGSQAGTWMVRDIYPGPSAGPQLVPYALLFNLYSMNGALWFKADDGIHGPELWKSDGTQAGTVLVQDFNAGSAGSNPMVLDQLAGAIVFWATSSSGQSGLWSTLP
ncbi:MAG: hypothetical protein NDJ89_13790 [Oligoflexia bacterium]|nr:hypothetical protein [Oligoflexia bacterium]